jgi:hypothetical protein
MRAKMLLRHRAASRRWPCRPPRPDRLEARNALDPERRRVRVRHERDTPDSLIPYDEIVQEALRAVVGRVLGEVEPPACFPGEHHFYITFKTGAAGRRYPQHLSERFPDEMTIVIQNRFWD